MLKLPNDYENVYIVCYPAGSGGNFLINCLALNDDFVLHSSVLAELQLAGKFGAKEKIQYLHDKLLQSIKSKRWNDLNLGNGQFFGIQGNEIQNQFPEILSFRINSNVNDVIDANKSFFWICHNILDIPILREHVWPRAKIIFFCDYRNFLDARLGRTASDLLSKDLDTYWQTVRNSTWPRNPPINTEQFYQLPTKIQRELTNDYNFQIGRWLDLTKETDAAWQNRIDVLFSIYRNDSAIWSVDENYSNEEKLILSLRLICQKFGFASLPETDIVEYFRKWRHTIAVCNS